MPQPPKHRLADLLEIRTLQELADEFFETTLIPSCIRSSPGSELTRSGWPSFCADFHLSNAPDCNQCEQSAEELLAGLNEGKVVEHTCPFGLLVMASPIVVDGTLVGGVLSSTRPAAVDEGAHRAWAHEHGYDEDGYLDAWSSVPVVAKERIHAGLTFLARQVGQSAAVGLARKREQEATELVRQQEFKYQQFLDVTNTVPWELDIETGRFLFVGPQAERLFGYPLAYWQDMDAWARAIHPDDRNWATSFCAVETAEGNDHEFTYRTVCADGQIVWVQDVVTVVDQPDGKKKLVGFMRDVTAKMTAELERKRLERQVRQAQRLEAVGTLAGGIAHDFNNILGAIIGYAELEALTQGQGRETSNLDALLTAAHRAKELVRQILAFSRKSEEQRQPIVMAQLVKEVAQLLRSTLPRTITIDLDINTDGAVLGQATQLHQVLMNLCTNAYHAMRERGGTLSIGLEKVVASASSGIVLTVSDTGIGMDAVTRERMYEPYFTTKNVAEGTGLGLSVVHGIVRSYGGTIRCESTPGVGTTISVGLPALSDATVGASLPKARRLERGTERVLVVDDEPSLSFVTKEMLESLGYEVTATTDSREAFELFLAEPTRFDAVVTDQTMPNLTGVDLAKRMLACRPELPIVLCTGYSDLVDGASAKKMGIACYLQKPFERAELGQAVREAIDTAQGGANPHPRST